ncbi:MFS transporter [Mesorhizobium sp. LSHC412B00]|uniref:MFS transporter n=1 Tax=Mesorhizobium sp. LSHC412B00 TaxID=1287285 RepID=UPI0003CF89A8|nr:MFS transporter [Mesorhizobium sp. LSHC412B00]ESX90844.1 inner membrane multidrug resistance transmembrane protein [Mesorhizobium sp. LSHC412B00]
MSELGTLQTGSPPSGAAPQPLFSTRLALGLMGILLAAMTAGLIGRVPGLVLSDIQGALGVGRDDGSWLTTAYSAGELAAMPFASWFAITFSMRRFHLTTLACALAISAIIPTIEDLDLLLGLRAFQGMVAGAMIPVLMMAALRFLPPPLRLYGLALFALTATCSPNVALWIAALCVDRLEDWRWVYWHVIPPGLLAAGLVAWGIPEMPLELPRLRQGNWLGMALGMPGLALLVVGVDQGVRLEWLHSPLITAALGVGTVFTALFLVSEWRHPAPFIRLQLLERRNIWLSFLIFLFLLMTLSTSVTFPANVLANLQGFRIEQSASIGLIVGLPQLVLGPCVALLLYRKWVDARYVFASGLACISVACWQASGITDEWMVQQFITAEVLQAVGQPMAVISLLFLATSVVQPREGPFVAGLVNILRVFSTTLGGALIGQVTAVRSQFHSEMLLDHAGHQMARLPSSDALFSTLGDVVTQQASVLATADVYRIFGILALVLIPLVLCLRYIPPPTVGGTSQTAPPLLAAGVSS